jgi:DNA-binding transcriptional ArsR family regulator
MVRRSCLLDGRAWTAAELARHAGVARSTATGHLNLLVAGSLLEEQRQGRHRYVRLANAEAAELIENLASMAPPRPAQAGSLAADSHRRGASPGAYLL